MGEVIKEEKGSWFGRLSQSLSLLLPRKLWCCAWRLLQPHNQALLFGYRLKLRWEWKGITSNLFRSADERDRVRLRPCTRMLTFFFSSVFSHLEGNRIESWADADLYCNYCDAFSAQFSGKKKTCSSFEILCNFWFNEILSHCRMCIPLYVRLT